MTFEHAEFKHAEAGQGYGGPTYMTIQSTLHAADYKGPFTIGVQYTAPASASQSLP